MELCLNCSSTGQTFFIVQIFSSLRTELSAKHAKHVSDLKLYYEHELDEVKSQLNRCKLRYCENFICNEKLSVLLWTIE